MKLNDVRPMLWTTELKETLEFYCSVLGFCCDEMNEEWGWACLHKDSVEIMFVKPGKGLPFEKPHCTGSLYITTDDVDGLWEKLGRSVRVCYPIENFDWGMREFAIYDNNGYILQFGEELEVV